MGDAAAPFADAGVGVWRDGHDIVIHRQATLPRYCVVTGEPAERECGSGNYLTHRPWIRVPLSKRVYRSYEAPRWWWSVCGLAYLTLNAAVWLASVKWGRPAWLTSGLFWTDFCLFMLLLLAGLVIHIATETEYARRLHLASRRLVPHSSTACLSGCAASRNSNGLAAIRNFAAPFDTFVQFRCS